MNLHYLASPAIGIVNPSIPAVLKVSTGSTVGYGGVRVPTYAADAAILAQVQALTGPELRQVEGLNLQGTLRGIYCDGDVEGIVRSLNKGGDLIVIATGVNAGIWLIVHVFESWPDWSKVCGCLQQN